MIKTSDSLYTGFDAMWQGCHPDNFAECRHGQRVAAVVIHTMAGYLTGTRAWFKTGKVGRKGAGVSSAHFGTGRQGQCDQYVKVGDTAYHAGSIHQPIWPLLATKPGVNPNLYTVGIENEDETHPETPWPEVQVHCCAWIIGRMAKQFGFLPIAGVTVVPHSAIDLLNRRGCPGNGAPSMETLAELAKLYMA